jgi:hypothetical protein
MATTLLRRAGVLLLASLFALAMTAGSAAAASEPNQQPAGLDHFHCYQIAPTTQAVFMPPSQTQLKDDFGTSIVDIGPLAQLCNPTVKTRLDNGQSTPIQNPDAHLTCFQISDTHFQPTTRKVTNQFGDAKLDVLAAKLLCLPSFKSLQTPPNFPAATQPSGLDHFKCYSVRYSLDASGNPVNPFGLQPANVLSQDQFGLKLATLGRPALLCNPAEKTRTDLPGQPVTPVTNPSAHLVCFKSEDDQQYALQPWLKNQFGIARVQGTVVSPGAPPTLVGDLLCLPSFSAPK